MQRHFDRRMEAHKRIKRVHLENELIKHVDLIDDPKVKAFVLKKKEIKQKAKEEKQNKNSSRGIAGKKSMMVDSEDEAMEIESEEE